MTVREATVQLTSLQKQMYAYNHALGVVFYDAETAAPKDSAEGRGEAIGILSGIFYELFANQKTGELLDYLMEHKDELTKQQARETELLLRDYDEMRKIPQEEYVAYQRLINEAQNVWEKAKRQNDFPAFAPYLEKIIQSRIRFAAYYDSSKPPYDVCLNQFERGLTVQKADDFFKALREKIVPLVHRIQAEGKRIDDSFLHQEFPIEQQKLLSDYLMEVMGIDETHCILGETEHPFTTEFNNRDVRITTHYLPNDITSSMFSVIHEGGHALYELHTADALRYTCLAGGTSMGIHESQSRFFENIIGRSEEFINLIFPKIQELFPNQFREVTPHQFYLAVNKSVPSLIRTEADELTYCLHIMVRYDIEKMMFSGDLNINELPGIWAEKMKEYLGIDVPDDARGVLQDVHWSNGQIGYFPSYAFGSAYATQIMAALAHELNVSELVKKGEMQPILDWLTSHIYQYGRAKDPEELLRICCHTDFDPQYYINYLIQKYTRIYELD